MANTWIHRLLGKFALVMALTASLGHAAAADPKVMVKTSAGDFTLTLNAEKAPVTVKNFLQYVSEGHYAGTIFHRVIDGFMVQGGGFDASMKEKATRAPIPLEASNGLKNSRGTIAMARTMNPNSATAQFFIHVVDNANLNAPLPDGHGYAVFGSVTQGMEVIDKIRTTPTGIKNGFRDVPLSPVTIQSITLLK